MTVIPFRQRHTGAESAPAETPATAALIELTRATLLS